MELRAVQSQALPSTHTDPQGPLQTPNTSHGALRTAPQMLSTPWIPQDSPTDSRAVHTPQGPPKTPPKPPAPLVESLNPYSQPHSPEPRPSAAQGISTAPHNESLRTSADQPGSPVTPHPLHLPPVHVPTQNPQCLTNTLPMPFQYPRCTPVPPPVFPVSH